MKVIAVIGQKGGCGKTTTTENLAVVAAVRGLSVAIIDLDSQATAAKWGDRRESENPVVVSAQVSRLRHVMDAAKKQQTQLLLIDTQARTSESSIEAVKVADLVLMPVRPEINDIETLPALRDVLALAGNPRAFVVMNEVPSQGGYHHEAQAAAEKMGFEVCPIVLGHRRAFSNAPKAGLGVVEYEPGGKAAQEMMDLYKFTASVVGL